MLASPVFVQCVAQQKKCNWVVRKNPNCIWLIALGLEPRVGRCDGGRKNRGISACSSNIHSLRISNALLREHEYMKQGRSLKATTSCEAVLPVMLTWELCFKHVDFSDMPLNHYIPNNISILKEELSLYVMQMM